MQKTLDDLIMQEVPLPQTQKGEVRVKNYAVSLNYRDMVVAKRG